MVRQEKRRTFKGEQKSTMINHQVNAPVNSLHRLCSAFDILKFSKKKAIEKFTRA